MGRVTIELFPGEEEPWHGPEQGELHPEGQGMGLTLAAVCRCIGRVRGVVVAGMRKKCWPRAESGQVLDEIQRKKGLDLMGAGEGEKGREEWAEIVAGGVVSD